MDDHDKYVRLQASRCVKGTDKLSHSLAETLEEKFSLCAFEVISEEIKLQQVWCATKKFDRCVKYLIIHFFKNWKLEFLQLLTVACFFDDGDYIQHLDLSHFVSANIDPNQ